LSAGRTPRAEHQRLGKQLTHDPSTGRTKRRTERDLAFARGRASEHEERNGRAHEADQHHEEDVDGHEPDRAQLGKRHDRRRERHHSGLQMLVRLREISRCAFADACHFGLSTRERCARRQSANDVDRGALTALVSGDVEAEWNPYRMRHGEGETFRHHADDRVRRFAEPKCSPDDRCVGCKARSPKVVSNDDDLRRPELFVALDQRASKQWLHTTQPKRGGGNLGNVDRLAAAVGPNHVAWKR
jgi:hypothetical protein